MTMLKRKILYGIVIIILGVLIAFGPRTIFPVTLLIVGIPYGLIGVCGNPHATCNMITRPALAVLGALLIGIDFILFYGGRKAKKEAEN